MQSFKKCNNYKYIMSQETGYIRLISHGIKPSVQRIAIIDYLIENKTHPTVDMIFNDLYPKIPTLSRTTVYNTLKLLAEQGAILMLTIDDKNSRYDADITPHAHFRCNKCGCIKDMAIKDYFPFDDNAKKIEITEIQLYCKGYCEQCLRNIDNKKTEIN